MNKNKILLLLSLSFFFQKIITFTQRDRSFKNLIIISDVINQDDELDSEIFNKFFDRKIYTPGPTGDILRDILREECAPVFVSKNLFQRCYNFFSFTKDIVEKDVEYIEKKYGKNPIETKFPKNNMVFCLKQLILFLLEQYNSANEFITYLQKQNIHPREIQKETLKYLTNQGLSLNDYNILSKKLNVHLYPILHLLASNIFMSYNSFNKEQWTTYATEHNNILLIPKNYPDDDFNKQKIHEIEPKVINIPLNLKINEKELKSMGKLFVQDINLLIKKPHEKESKPLIVFMAGHGNLPENEFSSGLSLNDFHDLIGSLGKNNTYAFFYLTCHAGGTTAQTVWFNYAPKDTQTVADAMYHTPFMTIVTPATEIAFRRKSQFWLEEFENNHEEYFAPWFLSEKIAPAIPLPRIKDFFKLITKSLPKALENSLYAPLYTIYRNQRSIIIPQAAIIRLPGTEWFAPQFFYEKVFEITKTKSAQALYEKRPLIQPILNNVIAISTPTIYVPLIINQDTNLKIVPLLSLDPSYITTKQHITYISELVIKESIFNNPINKLWNLSYTNIGPCMVIPKDLLDDDQANFKKIFVIENVIDRTGNILALNFTITPQGTFYTDPVTQKILLLSEEPLTENHIPKIANKSSQILFKKIQKNIDELLKEDNEAKNATQSVLHKYRTMKTLDAMLKKRNS